MENDLITMLKARDRETTWRLFLFVFLCFFFLLYALGAAVLAAYGQLGAIESLGLGAPIGWLGKMISDAWQFLWRKSQASPNEKE